MNPQETVIYHVAVRLLGLHITLNRAVPSDVGCAEAVSAVLLNSHFRIPPGGIPTVNGLIEWMVAQCWEEISTSEPGCIVTAHNPDPAIADWAHIGIGLKYGIASNNSDTGIFSENYSYGGWINAFEGHGSVVRYFRPL